MFNVFNFYVVIFLVCLVFISDVCVAYHAAALKKYGSISIKSNQQQPMYHQQQQQQMLPQQALSTTTKKMSPLEMLIFAQEKAGVQNSNNYKSTTMMMTSQFQQKNSHMNDFRTEYGSTSSYQQPVQAAVKSRHSVEYINIPYESTNIVPQTILVEAHRIPLNIFFQSRSSNLHVENEHKSSPGSVQETSSKDEPHHLIHRVTKPIIQEVYEVIKPYRKITQEVKPVQEDIQTIVSRSISLDNKYYPINNHLKGKNQVNQHNQIMMANPHQLMQLQQQTETYDTDPFSAASGSDSYGSIKSNPISYINSHTNTHEPDVFLNTIQTEMNRIKDYKPQPTGTSNSYIVAPMSLNSIIDNSNGKKVLTTEYQISNDIPVATYTLNPYHKTNSEKQIKLEAFNLEPSDTNGSKLMETSSHVTTLVPDTEISSGQTSTQLTSSLVTTTTTIKPEITETEKNLITTSSSSSNDNRENIMKDDNIVGNGIQSLMMYTSGGGSLFVTQPNLIAKLEDRKGKLKRMGYVTANAYATKTKTTEPTTNY